ncbi:ABC transporter ATP-binding protein [Paeniglutamicibacter kerguelensis]|uniref:ABC-2 type transport system ATP-binding protein n=1 Tax=Paeniglutamicibacter kerguelensis TaxID=254788 RepID=A0ABS4XB06_9MICC|nr:ABC transporter ATP-binding protein [Paeniglutamicibacter kerguelensis]MBP2385639.1 ABC-2 type transport system ATP-binding protein [Paeniglutamicibacter kerguelensis]
MTTRAGIKAERISKALDGLPVLDDVSLDVEPSQVHALIGLNGAGKTTLMRILLGMLKPDRGSVMLAGSPVSGAGALPWSRVGQMLETPFAYPELSARENVYSSARLHGMDRKTADVSTGHALAALGLDQYAAKRTGTLSLGNRQRVGLAAALVHAPNVIVLDEPTNSLDPRGVLVLRRLLRDACRDRRAAVLVSSHHLDEVARMADRISVLHRGRIIGTLLPGTADLERRFFDLVLESDVQGQEQ